MFEQWRHLHRHWEDWVNLLIACWLAFTPFLFGFAEHVPAVANAGLVALILILFAGLALVRMEAWEEWVNVVLGLWLMAAPWVIGFADHMAALWVHVLTGAVIAALAAFELWEEHLGPDGTAHA